MMPVNEFNRFSGDFLRMGGGSTGATGAPGATGPYGLFPTFSAIGQLAVRTGQNRMYVERAGTLTKVRGAVGTPSNGAAVVADVYKNTTLISTITIAAGSNTSLNTVSIAVAAGDYFTVNISGVGTILPGSDLTVSLTIE